ncbi:unnamed protein product [Polarella glacialis]|uniref:U-box domain-containing protein n=1 Tax=Polarella glacialis TaxID=89957 RepID=A0A813GEG2_POLGL|nr:unnamed protein product [Polarella glacialis]
MTDPFDLSCPILQSLLEDPVVAEDGNTYEREAIESHLSVRQQSPMTNTAMGKQVLPNQGVKSQVVNYKEKTVSEIISVVPRIPSGEAAKLLRRAEDFIRPSLPDSGARAKLLQLLHLRAELPAVLRGDAVKELLQMLVDGHDNQPLAELLGRFDGLRIESVMPSLDEKTIKRLHAVAQEGSLAQTIGKAALDLELACRLAGRATDPQGAQELWQLMLQLSGAPEPGVWAEAAGVVLAALQITAFQADLSGVAAEVLEHAARCMQNPRSHAARAQELFNTNLGLNSSADVFSPLPDLAKILLELACRQEDDKEAQKRLFFQARAADPANEAVRGRLVKFLSEVLGVEGEDQNEGLLLTMLFEEHQKVPDDLLPKLQLEPAQLKQLKLTWMLALAEQLAATNRSIDGACVAIIAAHAHEAASNKEAAQQAYIIAYGMDRSNKDAANGVVEMCSATTHKCSQLEARCQQQEVKNQQLEAKLASLLEQVGRLEGKVTKQSVACTNSVEWDVSSLNFSEFSKGSFKESSRFNLAGFGVEAYFRFCPLGAESAPAGRATLYLITDANIGIRSTLFLDSKHFPLDRSLSVDKGWGVHYPTTTSYNKVGLVVHEVIRKDSQMKFGVS